MAYQDVFNLKNLQLLYSLLLQLLYSLLLQLLYRLLLLKK